MSLFLLPILYFLCFIVNGLSVISNNNTLIHHAQTVTIRTFDRGHMELFKEYENERSMDIFEVEYVHPEGHMPFYSKKVDSQNSMMIHKKKNKNNFSTISNDFSFPIESNFADKNYRSNNIFSMYPREIYNNDYRIEDYSLRKKRRTFKVSIKNRRKSTKATTKATNIRTITNVESLENNRSESKRPASRIENSTLKTLLNFRNLNERVTTDIPWPLVPGPISCDLDFQLRPSFVAKLGEFDYVVSVQRQQNPDLQSEHACTGVVYNPRFIIIAPHCLHEFCDNYVLSVTSTDDLCTIDEVIEVDYVIEHENYDAETRKNDIALIKLKSEIHKKPATFAKDDALLGKHFYAVGFGELMWKSYPTKISKLLQKIPVQRHVLKEATGTLDITTSNLDLTGAFRGDFGGALINSRGELVGLKSKLVKKTIEYEVYTRVRTYLPWIESMVAIHGSW